MTAIAYPSRGGIEMETLQPTLDLFEQFSLERHALRILAMPQVQEHKKLVEELYQKNWLGKTREGRATCENAATALALFAAQFAVVDDPTRPRFIWNFTMPHAWHGLAIPNTAWGVSNPDNFVRWLVVDGASRYEISGQRTGHGPAQQTFLVYSSVPGTSVQNMEGATITAALENREIEFASDGSFTITVGPEPGRRETNHLQTAADTRVLIIRDTLGDWATQFPNRLRVRRIAGPPAPPPKSDEQLADEAAALLSVQASYWLKFWQDENFDKAPNVVPPLTGRSGGWGYLTTNWFQLNDDEALVMTLDSLTASYLAIQIADPWSITPDYVEHTSGLNRSQSKQNKDGTYTFVISPQDPGVWNWIDTVGFHLGHFTIRWQQLANPSHPVDQAVRQATVVKTNQLPKTLPPETIWIDATERKAQQAERAACYALRLAN
jgi:hypothetical protein